MLNLTGRGLEFCSNLQTVWSKLYLIEVARLVKEGETSARTHPRIIWQAGNPDPDRLQAEIAVPSTADVIS